MGLGIELYAMNVQAELDVYICVFLTFAIDGGEWSVSRPRTGL
jgi:hypothetical protein